MSCRCLSFSLPQLAQALAGLFSVLLVVLPAAAEETGWSDLFTGESLDGWRQRGGKARYTVEDGVLVGTSVPNTPNSFLCTEKNYADFLLELEFKIDPELNSGVQIRSNSFPEYQNTGSTER